jgi:hypothetical protein
MCWHGGFLVSVMVKLMGRGKPTGHQAAHLHSLGEAPLHAEAEAVDGQAVDLLAACIVPASGRDSKTVAASATQRQQQVLHARGGNIAASVSICKGPYCTA